MEYCKIESGIISPPESLPNSYKNVVGGFNLLSESKLNNYQFFRYVEPTYDPLIQDLGELVLNNEPQTVSRSVIDKTFDINVEKQNKIKHVKQQANNLLLSTDWYIIRAFERSIVPPANVTQFRLNIISRSNQMETEINALTDVREVLVYEIQF